MRNSNSRKPKKIRLNAMNTERLLIHAKYSAILNMLF